MDPDQLLHVGEGSKSQVVRVKTTCKLERVQVLRLWEAPNSGGRIRAQMRFDSSIYLQDQCRARSKDSDVVLQLMTACMKIRPPSSTAGFDRLVHPARVTRSYGPASAPHLQRLRGSLLFLHRLRRRPVDFSWAGWVVSCLSTKGWVVSPWRAASGQVLGPT